jgi:hypothetical protein
MENSSKSENKVEIKHNKLNTIKSKTSTSGNELKDIVNTSKTIETPKSLDLNKCIILDKEINYII